jgi:putative ABC transport system permease protein
MNLATARSIGRSREVVVRKSVGALRSNLIGQFLTESFLTVTVSLPLAIGLTHLALPAWRNFVGHPVTFDLSQASILTGLIGITDLVGFLAGSYPAFYLSTFDPTRSLRGVTGLGGGAFRKPLVIVQFALAVILVLSTFVATRQLIYVRGKRLGFNRDNILAIRIFDNDSSLRPNYQMVKERFSNHPAVIDISASASLPGEGWTSRRQAYEPGDNPGIEFEMRNWAINENWFPYIGVDVVAGRNFSADHQTDAGEAFILNETAVKQFGLTDPIGAPFRWEDKHGHIIGVVGDHHTRDLYENIGPDVFVLEPQRYRVVTLRFHPDQLEELMSFVTRTWKAFIPDRPLVYAFLDDRLEREYNRDVRFQGICAVAFGLAFFVSCLGLLGLAAFTAERRSKEIGIRKAIGASEGTIVLLLTNEFARLVVIANLVAWPIAYLVMDDWLTRFAYRIDQGALPYIAAGVLSLALALLTISYQAWRAAQLDPVDALRDE